MKKSTAGTVHHVSPADSGLTLAAFLRPRLGNPGAAASWSHVQRLVRSRHVMIHGNVCTDAARRLKPGEVVKLLAEAAPPPPRAEDVRVVHLDRDVVVVDKPSGITTTRHTEELGWPDRRRQVQPTLDEIVPGVIARRQAGRGRAGRGDAAGRPVPVRPVHRIDRETSGLVVFARTAPAERILAEQFRAHTTRRRYLALCAGRVNAGTIRTHLVRDRGDGRRGSSRDGSGKLAVTHVRPVEHFGDSCTLVECRLETGRTHQIRIHLSEIGHPVCGERVYVPARDAGGADLPAAPRVLLHAAELGFVHPASGLELSFSSPLPADMRRQLDRLRAAGGDDDPPVQPSPPERPTP